MLEPPRQRADAALLLYAFASFVAAPLVLFLFFALRHRAAERALPVSLPVPEAARPGWHGRVLDAPAITDASRPDVIVCYDPATAQHIADLPADSRQQAEEKVRRADVARRAWGTSSFARRRRLLRTIKKWCVDNMEGIARVACRDTGKTAVDALLGEILTTLSKIDWLVANTERVLKPEWRSSNLLLAHKRCEVHHVPLGVVAACVSWNYPIHNLLSPVVAALAAGNAVVVKVSEQVAWSSSYVLSGLRACLEACGEDPDLVQVVCCYPQNASAVTANPLIKHLTFIGSESVAKLVAMDAASAMIPLTPELGGKDPLIALPGTDLPFFVPTFLRAAFGAGGQNCIGIERFLVARSILPRFIELVEPRVRALQLGSFLDDTPFSGSGEKAGTHVDVGALITGVRIARLEQLVADAVSKGARCLVGGKRFAHPKHPNGHYFAPTLLVDVTPDMEIAQEELFAPVMLVMTFDTTEEAIQLANGTRYGLGSSVFGSNEKECRYVASRMEAGMCNINDFACGYLNQGLPFGGVKASGSGRFAGPEGLLSLTSTKAVTSDLLFRLVRTAIPPPLDYPLAKPVRAWSFARGLGTFAGGSSLSDKAWGLAALIRASF